VARPCNIILTGSPGIRCIKKNDTRVTPKITGKILSILEER